MKKERKKEMHYYTFFVEGMHCPSCDTIIKRKVQNIHGVFDVTVSRHDNKMHVEANTSLTSGILNDLFAQTEYRFSETPFKTNYKKRFIEIGISILILIPLFLLIKQFEHFTNGVTVQENMSLFFILGLGVVASFSSCIAVAGGLLLGISTQFAKKFPTLSKKETFVPHIYFNIGRLLSYIAFGFLIGYIGSLFTLSPVVTGGITFIAAALMIIIGLQLLDIIPFLRGFTIGIPQSLLEKFTKQNAQTDSKKHTYISSFLLGAATFFLPCGFTQAMQLYVLGVGSATFGAVALGIFAIGTLPSFLSIGALASFLEKKWLHRLSLFSGVLIIVLGFFLLPSSLTLLGAQQSFNQDEQLFTPATQTNANLPSTTATTNGNIQEIHMSVNGLSYSPHQFTVEKGVPVRWIIDGTGARGCGQILTMPKMDVFIRLSANKETIIEFTPTETGELPFHCSMAMTTANAKFIVV